MATENFELKFRPWKAKVLERLTLTEMKIKDGIPLTDEDEEFQKFLCRMWHEGNYPIYATKLKMTDETAVDQGLFSAKTGEDLSVIDSFDDARDKILDGMKVE